MHEVENGLFLLESTFANSLDAGLEELFLSGLEYLDTDAVKKNHHKVWINTITTWINCGKPAKILNFTTFSKKIGLTSGASYNIIYDCDNVSKC